MNKRNTSPNNGSYDAKINEVRSATLPPHIMKYCDGDRSVDLYLCCFYNNLPDLSLKIACEHFHLVSDTSCPLFSEVPDVVTRIEQLLTAKEENQCDSGQI